jgi:predicted RNA-binding Zn-ribbon protein involved in translation (DUF1610 family)
MVQKNESNVVTTKIAVRCNQCKRVVGYKIAAGTGRIQIKCPKCGSEMIVDLSMRRNNSRLFYRKATSLQ